MRSTRKTSLILFLFLLVSVLLLSPEDHSPHRKCMFFSLRRYFAFLLFSVSLALSWTKKRKEMFRSAERRKEREDTSFSLCVPLALSQARPMEKRWEDSSSFLLLFILIVSRGRGLSEKKKSFYGKDEKKGRDEKIPNTRREEGEDGGAEATQKMSSLLRKLTRSVLPSPFLLRPDRSLLTWEGDSSLDIASWLLRGREKRARMREKRSRCSCCCMQIAGGGDDESMGLAMDRDSSFWLDPMCRGGGFSASLRRDVCSYLQSLFVFLSCPRRERL